MECDTLSPKESGTTPPVVSDTISAMEYDTSAMQSATTPMTVCSTTSAVVYATPTSTSAIKNVPATIWRSILKRKENKAVKQLLLQFHC